MNWIVLRLAHRAHVGADRLLERILLLLIRPDSALDSDQRASVGVALAAALYREVDGEERVRLPLPRMQLAVPHALAARLRANRVREVRHPRPERHLRAQRVLRDEEPPLRVLEPVARGDEVEPVGEGDRDRDVGAAFQVPVVDGVRRIEHDLPRIVPAHVVRTELELREASDVLLQLREVAFARLDARVGGKSERHLE